MERREIKHAIESGSYRPEPELIAQAMLRRRGIRTLLADAAQLTPAGRIRQVSTGGRQAA
jgi:Anti-sigma-28 factor, FlgM